MFFTGNEVNAQAQLAGVSQDGLVQLGANHPFVVAEYQIDISHLNIQTASAANDFFRKYIDEGFTFQYDFTSDNVTMYFDQSIRTQGGQGTQVPVDRMNEKLRHVHQLRR